MVAYKVTLELLQSLHGHNHVVKDGQLGKDFGAVILRKVGLVGFVDCQTGIVAHPNTSGGTNH